MTTYFIWEDGEGCDERSWWNSIHEAEAAKVRYAEDRADGEEVTAELLATFEVLTAEELAARLAEIEDEDPPVEHIHGMGCSLGEVHYGFCKP